MSPGEFLRSVWPSEGIYCLAFPIIGRDGQPTYKQRTYKTIEDVEQVIATSITATEIFFNVHTLKAHSVPHISEEGKTQVRVQRNMAAAKCFFFDLDVGPKDNKYASQDEAKVALLTFLSQAQLPRPLVTSSGGGLHVYWTLTDPLESEEWRVTAQKLRQLAFHFSLKADPARTTDTSSVLRVVGTYNLKDRDNPRPVTVKLTAEPTPSGVFCQLVDDALIRAGIEAKAPAKVFQAEGLLGSNIDKLEYDGPTPTLEALRTACAQMDRLAKMEGEFTEPEWYHSVIGVGRFLQDGHRRIQQMSSGHAGYSHEACSAKIKQSEGSQKGPSSCGSVAYHSAVGDSLCVDCPFNGQVWGPIQAAIFKDPAPPPVVEEIIDNRVVRTEIPGPPPPYTRLKDGAGIAVQAKNADGDESYIKIYDYDLYPLRRLSNPSQGIEQQVWHVDLPRGESKDFTLDADALYDQRKFVVAIAHQGVYPDRSHLPHLQEYMVAYISQLQKLVDAEAQCNHLGWADDYTRFILPDKILTKDGPAKPAQLGLGAQRASAQVHKKGDAATQIHLLDFYNHPDYLPNQFYILASLAAPIFYATGHHGVIVNASGDAGASKSTSLYTAASFWGQPELYPINGTNNGATIRGRNERVTVLANLPVCVDEITHMPIKDAIDLAMSITQPGHRIRLQTDGVERASLESYKATIMLATANNSLHGMLSTDNTAGTAGSMRVFEILFKKTQVHKKYQADDYWHALKQNYGHIGELFVANVLQRLDWVTARVRQVTKEIDQAVGIQASERFWSATVASIIVAGEIAVELGLLKYDVQAIKRWALEVQLPYMRGVVSEEYSDPLAVLSDYLEQINGNILVMSKHNGNLNIQHMPKSGALLAHFDLSERVLYVLKKGFKDYCARIGANSLKILDELSRHSQAGRIIPNKHTRRTLGAGTDLAKAQSWCFTINMAHPEITGSIDLEVLTGGKPKSGPKGGLRAVP
jgi:hypothetical protein